MKSDEQQDRLVDLLLWELVGEETPPDFRDRVLKAADELPRTRNLPARPGIRLASSLPARRSKAPAFAIAALLTMLAVAGAVLHLKRVAEARTPILSSVSGKVDRSAGPLAEGESLSTGSLSSAQLTYPDGSVVELAADTTIVVSDRMPWDWSKGFEVVTGGVEAEVAPQRPGSPMVLTSKHAHAEVIGTKLTFDLNEERAHLRVTEGSVRFVPRKVGRVVLVESGFLAESGHKGFKHEKIPVPGIVSFTLMNADTNRPIREEVLVNGETVSLSSLPTHRINIRADYEGEPPALVRIRVARSDRGPTGLPPHASSDHEYPPYFVAGDHWAEGRPDDCQSWTPRPGSYFLKAEAIYSDERKATPGKPLQIKLKITK